MVLLSAAFLRAGCDPIAYAQLALAINEFAAPRWQELKTPTGESVGNTVLDQRNIPHEQWWIWCAAVLSPVVRRAWSTQALPHEPFMLQSVNMQQCKMIVYTLLLSGYV